MVRDWLAGLDPGFHRLRNTLRALFSILLSVGAVYGVGRLMPMPPTAIIFSGITAMLASRAAGAARRDRLLTAGALPFPILFAVSIAALSKPLSVWVGYAILVLIVYAAVEAGRFGARGTILGMSSVMAFFLATFIGATTSQLPGIALGVVLAACMAMLVREILVPDAPRSTLRWAILAFRAQGRHAARLMIKCLDGNGKLQARVGAALRQLNVCALAVDTALAAPGTRIPDRRRALLGCVLTGAELVVEDDAAAALLWGAAGQPDTVRGALAALVRGQPGKAARIAHSLELPPAPRMDRRELLIRPASESGLPIQTKQAIQATVACAAAIAVGQWLSPTRWYWAMLAAFVVFAGTASAGETRQKIWARVFGTGLGVAAGIGLAAVLGPDAVVSAALILILAVIGLYLQPISYVSMTFCVTTALGLLYTILGESPDRLLTLRLEETAVGALFAGLTATILLPIRTRQAVNLTAAKYLRALDQTVDASIRVLAGSAAHPSPGERSRALDIQLRDLIARSHPLLNTRSHRHPIGALASLSYYARRLARLAETAKAPACEAEVSGYRHAQTRIRAAIHVITGKVQANPIPHTEEVETGPATHDLDQIAAILTALAK